MDERKSISSRHALDLPVSETATRSWLAGIYDRYHQPIYRYIFRQVGDMETSRELTAEAFQRLIKAVQGDLISEESVAPWLYKTSHNLVIDHYRRQKHRQHLPIDESQLEAETDTAVDAEMQLCMDAVRQVLQEMKYEQKQVILLKFLEGCSNQEVAEMLGKSVGAVKSLQHRALAVLRHRLNELGLEGID